MKMAASNAINMKALSLGYLYLAERSLALLMGGADTLLPEMKSGIKFFERTAGLRLLLGLWTNLLCFLTSGSEDCICSIRASAYSYSLEFYSRTCMS